MEPSKHFDEQIKRAMENLESEASGAWELFEQKLKQAETAEADDLFRQRFEQFEAPLMAGGGWEAMEQLIEADEAAETIEQEAEIDNLVHEKLSNLEVPFQRNHWELMARRLEAEFALRKTIYRHKAAEIALVALLLLTFVRFIPFSEATHRPAAELTPQENIHAPQNQTAPAEEQPVFMENENGENQPAVLGTPVAENTESGDDILATAENQPEGKSENINQSNQKKDLASTTLNRKISTPSKIGNLSLSLVSSITDLNDPVEEFIQKNNRQLAVLSAQMNGTTEKLATLAPAKIKSKFGWEALPELKTLPFEKEKELRFSIFTTTDINYVNTPPDQLSVFDTTVATSEYKTLAAGYGGGILMSFKRNRTEFQTGGIYSFKRYIPNTPVFLFKTLDYYVKEDFNGIQMDILQVPVNVNYHMKDRGKWRFYGSAGISGNFVTTSVYEIEKEETPIFDPLAGPSSPDDFRTLRDEKEFPDGLADGGKLRDNLYFTFNMGLGVERYLSPKWVIFFQPNYQHFVFTDGVGTNRDKIYTTSFYLGTKFSLK